MVTTTDTRTNPLSYLSDQLNELKNKGTYFRLRVLEDEQAPECTFDGKHVINLASNNYLGLTTHPKLREAALAATRKYGVGSGAERTIAGTMKVHMELEEKIARFKNVEASVVFQSGFTANSGTVSAVLGKDDFIISDELNHASIIDGARLSKAKILVFRHKDVAHAEEQLRSVANQPGRKLLITDGVRDIFFNMSFSFLSIYMEDIASLSISQIGIMNSIFGVAMMAVMMPAGWLSDKVGERVNIAISFLFMAVSIGMIATVPPASPVWVYALGWTIAGIGVGLATPAYQSLISKAVPQRLRGVAFGLFSTSLGLVSLPAPVIGGYLWEHVSPQFPFMVTAFVSLLSIIPAWLSTREMQREK